MRRSEVGRTTASFSDVWETIADGLLAKPSLIRAQRQALIDLRRQAQLSHGPVGEGV